MVVDGDRVVSTATLLDEEVRVGGVRLPAGQVELVATDREYEGRGLVRALMRWAHERSAARGHVIQAMIGIPYFYRLFGYEYAVDIPPALAVRTPPPGEGRPRSAPPGPPTSPPWRLCRRRPRTGSTWPCRTRPRAGGGCWPTSRAPCGSSSTPRPSSPPAAPRPDDEILLAEAAALDEAAARDLLRGVAALAPGGQVRVVHRAGTVTAAAWRDLLDHEPRKNAEQYYIRIPDVAALLDRLRPLLWHRLTAAGLDRTGRDIVVSTFGAHYRIPVRADGLGEVVTGGAMQGPGAVGGAGVAPDYLPALLFGPHGIEGLTRIRPDVYAGDEELFRTLFPPLTADVLSYYLPY
nr:hypothetical protein GCM10020093_008080 [Planobispora longispora]